MMDTLDNLQDQIFAYSESRLMAEVFAEVSGISETALNKISLIADGICYLYAHYSCGMEGGDRVYQENSSDRDFEREGVKRL